MSSAAIWKDKYETTLRRNDELERKVLTLMLENERLRDERDGLAQTVRGYIVRDSQLDFFKEQLSLNVAPDPGATVPRALGEAQ